MKKVAILLAALVSTVFVSAQNEKETEQPDEQIIVNKKYDEDGNLIGYDSTYIHKWSSDTTLNFDWHGNDPFAGNVFPDIEKLIEELTGDSAIHRFDFPNPPGDFFDQEDFLQHLEHSLPDSAFLKRFLSEDSLEFQRQFDFPDMNEFQKKMEERMKDFNLSFPHNFGDIPEEQVKEMQELLEKQKTEREELRKKWQENKEY